jgi:hypothetical protein
MATNPLPEPKAQHYIPKFYLKGFTDKQGRLWVCEKFKPVRTSKPKHEAHRPDYYTHAEQGERDETAEDTLEEIESRAAPVVCKLANPNFKPTPEQMGHVYLFIAFTFARVPSWRENLDRLFSRVAKERQLSLAKDKEQFQRLCADMERDTGKPLDIDAEELRQYILKGKYEIVQASRAYNLGSMFQSALSIARTLQEFGYEVLYAPKGRFFLTSDSPVFTLQPETNRQATIGMGFGWPRVLVHFPLNKRACLRLKRGAEPAAIEISEYDLGQINRVTMANASQFLYSSEGYRRISRLFDQWGCKIEPGKNAFMPTPEPPKQSSTPRFGRR